MTPLRIGLAGAGAHARRCLAPALRAAPEFTLVACADPAAASLPGVRHFDRVEQMLADTALDAVVVATPPAQQATIAGLALAAGLHVYLEKPGARLTQDLRDLARLAQVRDRRVALGYNYRFLPAHLDITNALRTGRFGRLSALQSLFTGPAATGWRADPAQGGGALRDLAAHEIDLARHWFADEVESVCATIQSQATAADTASLELRFRRGGIAQIFSAFGGAQQARVELLGEYGRLTAARWSDLAAELAPAPAPSPLGSARAALGRVLRPFRWLRRRRAPGGDESRLHCLREFARLVHGVPHAAPTVADGIACLEILAAAEESERGGRRIHLSSP